MYCQQCIVCIHNKYTHHIRLEKVSSINGFIHRFSCYIRAKSFLTGRYNHLSLQTTLQFNVHVLINTFKITQVLSSSLWSETWLSLRPYYKFSFYLNIGTVDILGQSTLFEQNHQLGLDQQTSLVWTSIPQQATFVMRTYSWDCWH